MLGAMKVVASKVRALLLWLFATLRRACCCFKRRRRNSESQMLTAVGVVPNQPPEEVTQGWETWGREEDEVTRQIREYRNSLSLARQQSQTDEQEQPAADFFQDMTPKITRPPRIALASHTEHAESGASQLLAPLPLPIVGGELGTWTEEEGWEADEGGWEEEVREQRRQQRMRRAEEVQTRRSEHRGGLGARLS